MIHWWFKRKVRIVGRDEVGNSWLAQQFGDDMWWLIDGQLWPEWLLEWR